MANLTRKILTVALIATILCLTGCTPLPHTAKQATRYLEKRYESKGRFTLVETVSEGTYIYHDNKRNVDFKVISATWGWGQSGLFPLPHRSIYVHLNRAIRHSKCEQALAVAETYGVKLVPLVTAEDTRETIYVTDFSQLSSAAELFFALEELYQLESANRRDENVVFYYCSNPAEITAESDIIQLDWFHYQQLYEGEGYVVFDTPSQLQNALETKWKDIEKWNDSIPSSQISP